jgi:hypothetical protein
VMQTQQLSRHAHPLVNGERAGIPGPFRPTSCLSYEQPLVLPQLPHT